jgi:hypothetical protein
MKKVIEAAPDAFFLDEQYTLKRALRSYRNSNAGRGALLQGIVN